MYQTIESSELHIYLLMCLFGLTGRTPHLEALKGGEGHTTFYLSFIKKKLKENFFVGHFFSKVDFSWEGGGG